MHARRVLLTAFIAIASWSLAADSMHVETTSSALIEERLKFYESRIAQLEANGSNYRIENELLKQTYQVNYERLNFFLAGLGALFAFLSFYGLRSINQVRDQYRAELERLNQLQSLASSKADEFQNQKERFEADIKRLKEENEAQDKRIQFAELLEKAQNNLTRDVNRPFIALPYVEEALELRPNVPELLRIKAQCLNRMNRASEAVEVLRRAVELDRDRSIADLMETLLFVGEVDKANEMVEEYKSVLDLRLGRSGGVYIVTAFALYHKKDLDGLRKTTMDLVNRFPLGVNTGVRVTWGLVEALSIAMNYPESDRKNVLLNFLWWCDNQISGQVFLDRIR